MPDDIDSGNETDSESKEDTPATFAMELIVAYLDDLNCNDPTKKEDEWVINENAAFDYSLYFNDVPNFIDCSSLHMPLPTSMTTCMHIEDDDGSVFIFPSPKKGQLLIIFGRI